MIRIKKPRKIPSILKTKGRKEKLKMCAAYENKGQRDFDFDRRIYGGKTVKEALIRAQHDKCFLCESKITHIDYGDVEHFRPKKAFQQNAGEKLNYPGYYWLAYDWKNLFLACKICNQRHKKNLFPLANPEVRKTLSHLSDLRKEKPLFINPAKENLEKYISFRVDNLVGVVPFAINGSVKGKATIKGLGLDRLKLCDKRMAFLKPILALHEVATMNRPQPESDRAKAILQEMIIEITKDSAEYAGMFRAMVKADFQLV